MKAANLRRQLTEAKQDLAALRGDLPKIERLLEQHRGAVTSAKAAGKSFEELAELQQKADTFASVLAQHREDIRAAESKVSDLEAKLAKQSAGERLASATKEHDELQAAYRDALRAAIDAFQKGLREAKVKRDGLEVLRGEIYGLALTLGLERPTFRRLDVYSEAFKGLLFDKAWPKLSKHDDATLQLIGALMAEPGGDEVILSGDSRQVLGRREAERRAGIKAAQEARRDERRAELLQSLRARRSYLSPSERAQLERLEAQG